MRGLLFVVILVIIVIGVSRILNTWRRTAVQRANRRDELVKDPVCQTYVVLSRAVTTEMDGARTHFCSRECAARFARGERRR